MDSDVAAVPCHLLLPSSRKDKNPEEASGSYSPPHSPRSPLLLFLSRNRAQSLTLAFTAAVVHLTSPANQTSSRPKTLSIRFASSSSSRRCHLFVLGATIAVERHRRPEQSPPLSTKIPTPSSLLRCLDLVLYTRGELILRLHRIASSIESYFRDPRSAIVHRRRTPSPPSLRRPFLGGATSFAFHSIPRAWRACPLRPGRPKSAGPWPAEPYQLWVTSSDVTTGPVCQVFIIYDKYFLK